MNYPLTPAGPRGTKITGLVRTYRGWFHCTPAGGDVYKIEGDCPQTPEPVRNADNTALKADYVSVTPMDADWSTATRLD
ncbi:hypothetical protein [Actinomadura sp. NPDC000600]|uniref:hypothetical protein n=1 Tax=Actinomadura sp. NPDC000600 TaxID=3154262 RepID=UPI00339923F0